MERDILTKGMMSKNNFTFSDFLHNVDNVLLKEDNDPDTQFYGNLNMSFDYFDTDQIEFSNTHFSILCFNIRSVNKNFENFTFLLKQMKHKFKVICLIETWCRTEDILNSNFQIPGYKAIHQPRKSGGKGGGVSIFVHNSFTFKKREDLNINCSDCESLTVELKTNDKLKNQFLQQCKSHLLLTLIKF